MELQHSVLRRYMELKNSPTLKEISEDTGIQITRVFRLLNGSEMKLSEFENFREKVSELEGDKGVFISLAQRCDDFLSSKTKNRIMKNMVRFLKLSALAKNDAPLKGMSLREG